jgi:hypothetical protein
MRSAHDLAAEVARAIELLRDAGLCDTDSPSDAARMAELAAEARDVLERAREAGQ